MTPTTDRPTATALATVLEQFFATKTACDVDGTMSYFAPDMACYMDATLGWDFDSFDSLKAVFEQYMPTWAPPARSYASKILAGESSALVHMVDTPELFGGELRILAAVDFDGGKIVRWIDYWDSTAYDTELYDQVRTPADRFPRDHKDAVVSTRASSELVAAASALQTAFAAGDAQGAAALLHPDATVTDMATRATLVGRVEALRFFTGALAHAPYGGASTLRHVVGGRLGGGFEWTAGEHADGLVGNTAIELDGDGLITSVTSVYDSRTLDPARRGALVQAAAG